jgi:hypothetical protein
MEMVQMDSRRPKPGNASRVSLHSVCTARTTCYKVFATARKDLLAGLDRRRTYSVKNAG